MININNICFSYTNQNPYIIEGMSLNIKKGSYVSILGDNGSGKSTLVKLILSLLKPNSGEILINSKNTGYVPQRGDGFNSGFPITVLELLKCHAKVLKIKEYNKSISNAIDMIGISNLKKSLIGNLSGGQQQKVFISRALIGSPELLILDEPSTGIDAKSQDEIYNIIKSLNKDRGLTVISVEHNMDAALKNSSHILKMKNGSGVLYENIDHENIKEDKLNYASI